MTFFIAILFICSADQCNFAQIEPKYMDARRCEEGLAAVIDDAKASGLIARGVCLPVNIKDIL